MMSENVVIVNTHPDKNPDFAGNLVDTMNLLGIESEITEGYQNTTPLDRNPSHIILTGVPADANYSLVEKDTQNAVERAFGWLRESNCPVLGICYGHQILAHILGGKVSSLKEMVIEKRLPLVLKTNIRSGIFSNVEKLEVFAEHIDFVSEVPAGFSVLCQIHQIPYIMYHPEREMYGVQFVPERSDEGCKELLKRFVGR
jgi:GMP synthase (glutamine-hydrolysing)